MAVSLDNIEEGRVSSDETRAILAQAMSAQAALQSMGIGADDYRAQEQADLNADMERKNAAIAARLASEQETKKSPVQDQQQKPVKSRRKRGMVKQTSSQPVEQPVQESGMTLADRELIEQVKRDSSNKVMAARRMFGMAMPPAPAQDAPGMPQVSQPSVQESIAMAMATPVVPQQPAYQEQQILNERAMATVNGQGNPGYGEASPFAQVQLQLPERLEPVYATNAPVTPVQPVDPKITVLRANPQQAAPANQQMHVQLDTNPPQYAFYPQQAAPANQQMHVRLDTDPPQYAFSPHVDPARGNDVQAGFAAQMEAVEPDVDFDNPPMVKSAFDPSVQHPDYEAWTVIRGLPSRGLLYGGPLRGQAFKTVDLLMLDDMDDEDENENTTAVLAKRLRGANPEDILYCDEEYIMHWLRASSFPQVDLYSVAFTCPHCGEDFGPEAMETALGGVNFRNLSFKCDLDPVKVIAMHAANATPDNPAGFVKYMMYDGRECDIYLRRRKHERIVREHITKWEAAHDEEYPAKWNFPTRLAALVEIEDCPTMEEKVDFILNYPAACRTAFYMAIAEASLSCNTFVNLKCPSCGGAVEAPYPFHKKLFLASI